MVDEELNQGRWVDGYDLAISLGGGVIERDAACKLLKIILAQNPSLRIDEATLRTAIEAKLPQNYGAPKSWIVDERGSFALTDSLRVARFEGSSIVWRSPRISYDGIEFDSLSEGRLCGRSWWPDSDEEQESRFIFDFETGELLRGQVVRLQRSGTRISRPSRIDDLAARPVSAIALFYLISDEKRNAVIEAAMAQS
ncbi:MAG: hypothetical protein EOP18_05455, partial [Rhizobiaceae bacterium]